MAAPEEAAAKSAMAPDEAFRESKAVLAEGTGLKAAMLPVERALFEAVTVPEDGALLERAMLLVNGARAS